MATEAELVAAIGAQGERIRVLKAAKDATKADELKAAIAELLALKTQFQEVTGKPFDAPKAKPAKKSKTEGKADGKTKPAEGGEKESKISKKELNKQRKKAAKAAWKSGETKDEKAQEGEGTAKAMGEAKPAKACKDAVGRLLPVPGEGESAFVVFSTKSVLPLATFVVATLTKQTNAVQWRNHAFDASIEPTLVLPSGDVVSGDFAIARYLCRLQPGCGLFGVETHPQLVSQIDSWLDFASSRFPFACAASQVETRVLTLLDLVLKERTFLVGYAISLADIALYARVVSTKIDAAAYPALTRWLQHLQALDVFANAAKTLQSMQPIDPPKPVAPTTQAPSGQKAQSIGVCPPLEGAVDGEVCTRFPPEASGYMHIGHLKAALLNDYYRRRYHGRLIIRFDDTNPTKERQEFETSILNDLALLDIVGDIVTYTSDSFPKIIDFTRKLIKEGHAYMDNTPQEQMREERMQGIPSKCRDQPVEQNLELFEHLLVPNDDGAEGYCLRAKIDMQAGNKTLRDPVIFRANATPHARTGTKYAAYPTYDLACPIVDSTEGVTHALRTTEYNDRDAQYAWVLKTLGLRPVRIHAFARLNFVNSVLSKRKLQWFVDQKLVTGWNDPRFPTIQGVLRRGVQVEALREFIISQGASRRNVDMEWDKFWVVNKRLLEPMAPRYFAVNADSTVPLLLTNVDAKVIGKPIARHPKDPSMGNKIVRFCNRLLLERDDVEQFAIGDEVTLMRHGNIIIRALHKDANGVITQVEAEDYPQGDFKTTKLKITWVADVPDLVHCTLVEFDFLISKPKLEENDNFEDFLTPVTRAEMHALGDHEIRTLKKNSVLQIERRGFFRVDEPYLGPDKPIVLFMVPDGKARAMSTLSKNLVHR